MMKTNNINGNITVTHQWGRIAPSFFCTRENIKLLAAQKWMLWLTASQHHIPLLNIKETMIWDTKTYNLVNSDRTRSFTCKGWAGVEEEAVHMFDMSLTWDQEWYLWTQLAGQIVLKT